MKFELKNLNLNFLPSTSKHLSGESLLLIQREHYSHAGGWRDTDFYHSALILSIKMIFHVRSSDRFFYYGKFITKIS